MCCVCISARAEKAGRMAARRVQTEFTCGRRPETHFERRLGVLVPGAGERVHHSGTHQQQHYRPDMGGQPTRVSDARSVRLAPRVRRLVLYLYCVCIHLNFRILVSIIFSRILFLITLSRKN